MPEVVETADDPHAILHRQVAEQLPGDASWIRELRTRAADAFRSLEWPTTRDEAWRYTSIKPITRTSFQLPDTSVSEAVDAAALAPFLPAGLDAHLAVVVDGAFRPDLSRLDDVPAGLSVRSLAEVLATDPSLVEGSLGAVQDLKETRFAALNTMFLQDGVVVDVADGTEVARPLHVLFITAAHDGPTVTHPRLLVHTGTSTELTLLETHGSLGDDASLTNLVTELDVGDDSRLTQVRVQRQSLQSFHVGRLAVREGRASNVDINTVDLGSTLARNDVNVRFEDEGSELHLVGLYSLHGDQHVDNHTIIEHLVPHCSSRELYKGILDERSRGAFLGKIHVHPGAQKTDAYQHNPNLVLSRGALVNTRPQLEIFADDVKCSHGSTIGQVDDDWVFYLRSRGLPEAMARSLLVYSFAREVVDRFPAKLAAARDQVESLLLDRLPHGAEVRDAMRTEA